MVLETCRYRLVNGKVITKLFGMKGNDWDIEPGWHHSPKDAKKAATEQAPETVIAQVTDDKSKAVKVSRFARKLADDLEIDVNKVTGTGKKGVITKDDITNHYNLEVSEDGNGTGSD